MTALARRIDEPAVQRRPRWYVVKTHAHAERLAVFHLQRQSFEVYRPMLFDGGGTRAMFPRYLFVAIDTAAERWRSIFSTIGVKELLCAGERPVPVPDGVIARIKSREVDGMIRLSPPDEALPCPYQPGDAVQADVNGVLVDAIFKERLDAKRVTVLLKWLGRETQARVHLAHLR